MSPRYERRQRSGGGAILLLIAAAALVVAVLAIFTDVFSGKKAPDKTPDDAVVTQPDDGQSTGDGDTTGDTAGDTSADGDDAVASCKRCVQHFLQEMLEFIEALALLALRDSYYHCILALRGNRLGVPDGHSAVGHDKRTAV